MSVSGNRTVSVVIRVRPVLSFESSDKSLSCHDNKSIQLVSRNNDQRPKGFTFDHVFNETTPQEEIFQKIGLPIVESFLKGFNGTIFAYGQTTSGKTYTMTGDETTYTSSSRGLIPRVISHLFKRLEEMTQTKVKIYTSFLEIYNERIIDLLNKTNIQRTLHLREDPKTGVFVDKLIRTRVSNAEETWSVYRNGNRNRKVGSTNLNKYSSRSHSVLTVYIESKTKDGVTTNIRRSKLHLIDLAGSERQRMTKSSGERLTEACAINKSLSCLGMIINSLCEREKGRRVHVHYRDSKLTFLLKDSLGGNSKTAIICNVSPSFTHYNESFSTLSFASRAKKIKNRPVVNEDIQGNSAVLQAEINHLRKQVQKLSMVIEKGKIENKMLFPELGLNEEVSSENDKETIINLQNIICCSFAKSQLLEQTITQFKEQNKQLKQIIDAKEDMFKTSRMLYKMKETQLARLQNRSPIIYLKRKKVKYIDVDSQTGNIHLVYKNEEEDYVSSNSFDNYDKLQEIVNKLYLPENNPTVLQCLYENKRMKQQIKEFNENGIGESYVNYLHGLVNDYERKVKYYIEKNMQMFNEEELRECNKTLENNLAKSKKEKEYWFSEMNKLKIQFEEFKKNSEAEQLRNQNIEYEVMYNELRNDMNLKVDIVTKENIDLKNMCFDLLNIVNHIKNSQNDKLNQEIENMKITHGNKINDLMKEHEETCKLLKEEAQKEKSTKKKIMEKNEKEKKKLKLDLDKTSSVLHQKTKELDEKKKITTISESQLINKYAKSEIEKKEFKTKLNVAEKLIKKLYVENNNLDKKFKKKAEEVHRVLKEKEDLQDDYDQTRHSSIKMDEVIKNLEEQIHNLKKNNLDVHINDAMVKENQELKKDVDKYKNRVLRERNNRKRDKQKNEKKIQLIMEQNRKLQMEINNLNQSKRTTSRRVFHLNSNMNNGDQIPPKFNGNDNRFFQ